MTNGEAINWLINISADIGKAEHRDLWHYEQALSEIKEMLETAQPEPQWIPCSERLPEYDGEMYLVTDYCEQINRRRLHTSYCYVNREGFWSDVPLGYKVVAWMPLPEPWRGEYDAQQDCP